MIKRIFILFFLCFFSFSLFSIPADVENISNRKYFPVVKKLIQEARKEIKISLYYITLTPKGPVSELMQELVQAKERGVDIEVVLDFSTLKGKAHSEDMKNAKAFSFLKQKGIRVFYDSDKILNHSKYLVVDAEAVVVGSVNWSEPAFERNHENAVLIRSPEIAAEYLEDFKAIPRIFPDPVKGAVPIPAEFLTDLKLAAKMAKNSEDRMIDFYLLCQKLSFEQKTNRIRISEAVLEDVFFKGKVFKLGGKDLRVYFISRFLAPNRKTCSFMKSYKNNIPEKVMEIELTAENIPGADSLWLSELYWKGRWFSRLPPLSKFFLLQLLHKTDSQRLGRSFQFSLEKIHEEYGISLSPLSRATTELQRYNLIEKQNFSRKDNYVSNIYILNDFYLYEDFEKELQKIKENTDPEIFEAALKVCDITNETHDLEAIKKLAALGKQYGAALLKKAYEKAEGSGGDSPFRHLSYLMAIINNWVKEGSADSKN